MCMDNLLIFYYFCQQGNTVWEMELEDRLENRLGIKLSFWMVFLLHFYISYYVVSKGHCKIIVSSLELVTFVFAFKLTDESKLVQWKPFLRQTQINWIINFLM